MEGSVMERLYAGGSGILRVEHVGTERSVTERSHADGSDFSDNESRELARKGV